MTTRAYAALVPHRHSRSPYNLGAHLLRWHGITINERATVPDLRAYHTELHQLRRKCPNCGRLIRIRLDGELFGHNCADTSGSDGNGH